MSEYKKRILAYSAVAIIIGISISAGIAFLPSISSTQSRTTLQASTLTSTATVVTSIISTITTSFVSTNQVTSSTTAPINGTTVIETTVVSSSSTVVSNTVSSSSSANSSTGVTTSTTTSVSCVVSGYPDGIYLQILTNSGAMISGSLVSGQSVYAVNGQECTNPVLTSTNSTGWAYLGSNPGTYYVSLSYSGNGYNLTIPSKPVTESIATYYIPSGNLTIEYCTYGNPQMCSS